MRALIYTQLPKILMGGGKTLIINLLIRLIGVVVFAFGAFHSSAGCNAASSCLEAMSMVDSTATFSPQSQYAIDGNHNQPTLTAQQTKAINTSGSDKHLWMDIRTNMLFDIAAVPNLGAEFYLGKNFSILADWMYGWWSSNHRHRYWQIYGGGLGARWYFGRKADAKPLTGHHLGVYGSALIFDFEWGSTGYMGGKPGGTLWDRCLVNSGIEYGYSLPIGSHLNIDFSIGLGYLGGNYIKYFTFDNDYYREKEYKMHFFGPTKAEISLVWLLGRGNSNNRKGGGE